MLLKAYEILEDVVLIREESTKFTFNFYILTISTMKHTYKILIDPLPYGYWREYEELLKKRINKEDIKFLFITHEDPIILSSIPEILKSYPDINILASNNIWKYLNVYDIKEEQFHPIEFIPNRKIRLDSEEISFVYLPFCTSVSAYALYYRNKNILFSGDFLSSFLDKKDLQEVWASDKSILSIKLFHECFVSHSFILKNALDKIGRLEEIPEIILPHHGNMIKKELLDSLYKELSELKVGIEYLKDRENLEEKYLLAINDILKSFENTLGHKYILSKLQKLNVSSNLYMELFKIENGIITEIRINPSTALELILNTLKEDLEGKEKINLEKTVKEILGKYGLAKEEGLEYLKWFESSFERFLKTFSRLHGLQL